MRVRKLKKRTAAQKRPAGPRSSHQTAMKIRQWKKELEIIRKARK